MQVPYKGGFKNNVKFEKMPLDSIKADMKNCEPVL